MFCQLLGEPSEKQKHGFHGGLNRGITKTCEMVLVAYERTRTFGLCSIYFLFNVVSVRSFRADEKKDLVFLSDGKAFQKHYRFEDFFWTGFEGDEEKKYPFRNDSDLEINLVEASPFETWKTTTVFFTTTILFATVYPNTDNCKDSEHGCTPQVSPVQTKSIEFSLPTVIPEASEILPCPTQKGPQTNTFEFPDVFYNEGNSSVETATLVTPKTSTTKKQTGKEFPETDVDDRNVTGTTVFPTYPIDQKYWIMTVLRNNNFSRNLELNLTENKLSTLYKKALNRRQEKFFGESDFQERRDRKLLQPVKVNILNVTRVGTNMEIIYYVSVAGQPVPAMTAANDMRLMTVSEVIAELGYPILSKAEPYIKNVVPLGARVKGRTRDTWLFIGSVIAAVLLLITLATLFALGLSRKPTKQDRSKTLRQHVFGKNETNKTLIFEDGQEATKFSHRNQPKDTEFKGISQTAGSSVKFTAEERRESTTSSSCSGSSEASLVRLRHQQKRKEKRLSENVEKPKPKPRTRIKKIENSNDNKQLHRRHALDRTGSAISRNTYSETVKEGYDDSHYSPCLMRSPTSYLSMPSVRAFPRGTQIPESLNKILEPISIRHLDADSDSQNEYSPCSRFQRKVDVEQICEVKSHCERRKNLTRHASLEGDDPGFIGPVVWNRYCQKISEKETDEINMEEVEENVNIGKMRRRFNELLDDALSMFGSRNPSPEAVEGGSIKQPDNRVHSAVVRPAGLLRRDTNSRPKTTGSRRPYSAVISGPKGAWETPSCSTLVHSETTTAFQKLSSSPIVDKNLINVNCELAPSDPAVPLIAAIKNELKKFEDPPCNEI